MPITELKEPYWDKQDGETPNQYCYFLEFLEYKTNDLKDFHQHLCEKDKKGLLRTKVPAYKTIRNWSGPACNKWTERKSAKRAAEKKDVLDTLHELYKEDVIEEYILKKSIKHKLLVRLDGDAETEKFSQIKHGVDAYTNLNDDNRVDRQEPTSYTKTEGTLEVEADTKITNPGLDKIAEAFENGRKEYRNESSS